jgi:replication initiator protein RepSA
MFGFRGHFSTKSRRYSITLSALRTARSAYQREYAITTGAAPDPATFPSSVLVLSTWNYYGRGHPPSYQSPNSGSAQEPAGGGEHLWT